MYITQGLEYVIYWDKCASILQLFIYSCVFINLDYRFYHQRPKCIVKISYNKKQNKTTIQESFIGNRFYIRVYQFDVNKSWYQCYQNVRLNYVWSSFESYNLQSKKLDSTTSCRYSRGTDKKLECSGQNSAARCQFVRTVRSLER